jgi:WD40 repeat protein
MSLLPGGIKTVLRLKWLFGLGFALFGLSLIIAACAQPSKEIGETVLPRTPEIPEKTIQPCTPDNEVALSTNLDGLPGVLSYMVRLEEIRLIGNTPLTESVLISTAGKTNPTLRGFSPNGQWLAYSTGSPFEGVTQTLSLISSNGQEIHTTPATGELVPLETGSYTGTWGGMIWINDETILIYILQTLEDLPGYPHYIKALVNPFTGEWQQFFLESLDRQPDNAVLFSPDMTKALYVSEVGGLATVKLWDSTKQEVLWQNIEDTLDTHFVLSDQAWIGAAAWTPDSNWIALTAVENRNDHNWRSVDAQGVYLLDRNGQRGKFITDYYQRFGRSFTASDLSWSPDSRFLAMSVTVAGSDADAPSIRRLFVYDLEADELTDFCWFIGDTPGAHSATGSLIWSPDSQYIAYAGYSSNPFDEETPSALVVINIYTGELAAIVDEAVLLGGWSAHFSP